MPNTSSTDATIIPTRYSRMNWPAGCISPFRS